VKTHKLLFVLLASAGVLSAAENKVVNGNFESRGGWSKSKAVISQEDKHSGNSSLFFAENTKLMQIFSCKMSVKAAALEFSFWFKGEAPNVTLRFFDTKNKRLKNVLGKDFSFHVREKSSLEWTLVQKSVPLPADLQNRDMLVDIQIQKWRGGKFFIDDIELKCVSAPKEEMKISSGRIKDYPWIVFSSEKQEELPPITFPYKFGSADGLLTKNGIPHFYAANASLGGGQFTPQALWLSPLLNYSAVSLDWGFSGMQLQVSGKKLLVNYKDTVPSLSLWRELNRIGIVVEHDTGNASPRYNRVLKLKDKLKGNSPELESFVTTPSHFYSYDHNTEIGREFHRRAWQSRYFHLKGSPVMATEVYNELGYSPDHPRFLKFFREFVQKKYGDLATANRVWHTNFKSWNEVVPPRNLSGGIKGSAGGYAVRAALKKKYWQLNYDYLRACQLDLIPGLQKMKADLAKLTNSPMLVDWRGHSGRDSDSYSASDPDLLEDVVGVFALHTSMYYFDFKGQPADELTILDFLTHNVMHHEFVSSNTKHPIINPEAIQSTKAIPGTSAVSMKKNSFKDFSLPWQFTLEEKRETGLDNGYWKTDFDDRKWSKMSVPGCWDETAEFKGKSGYGWYRTTFKVPAILKNDWEDGSRRFCIYGKGIAQCGTFWINGIKIGEHKGWNRLYKFDISNLLKYGEENQITVLIDGPAGSYANGFRAFFHILPEDKISGNELFDEKAYMSAQWTAMTHGCSSMMIWHWDSTWRPFLAKVNTSLENGEALLMPAGRHRGSRVAMLMPFLGFKGLPTQLAKDNQSYMKWYAGVLFNQTYPALLTEKNMSAITPEKYPVAFYPYAKLVFSQTYDSFKKYVQSGGTAVVTFNSMDMTFDRYSDSGLFAFLGIRKNGEYDGQKSFTMFGKEYPVSEGDAVPSPGIRFSGKGKVLAAFADGTPAVMEIPRGKGKVIFAGVNMGLEAVHALAEKILKEAKIKPAMEFADKGSQGEFPYLEGFFGGNADRFALYTHNWGGLKRKVTVKLPYAKKYDVRNAIEVDDKVMNAEGTFSFTIGGSSPVCFIFEKPGIQKMALKRVSEAKKAVLAKIDSLKDNPKDLNSKAPKILLIDGGHTHMRTIFPHLALAVKAAGGEVWTFPAKDITPELLKKFDSVVLLEAAAGVGRNQVFPKTGVVLSEYMKNGGKVLLLSSQMKTAANSRAILTSVLGKYFGFSEGDYIKDASKCSYNDPYQVYFTEFGMHPVAKGVKEVQFFVSRKIKTSAKKVTAVTPIVLYKGEPVALSLKQGKGELMVFSDLLWLQPTRIHDRDNAVMLRNLASYLIGRNGSENPYKPFENE